MEIFEFSLVKTSATSELGQLTNWEQLEIENKDAIIKFSDGNKVHIRVTLTKFIFVSCVGVPFKMTSVKFSGYLDTLRVSSFPLSAISRLSKIYPS